MFRDAWAVAVIEESGVEVEGFLNTEVAEYTEEKSKEGGRGEISLEYEMEIR